jgi:hypothetical protein
MFNTKAYDTNHAAMASIPPTCFCNVYCTLISFVQFLTREGYTTLVGGYTPCAHPCLGRHKGQAQSWVEDRISTLGKRNDSGGLFQCFIVLEKSSPMRHMW